MLKAVEFSSYLVGDWTFHGEGVIYQVLDTLTRGFNVVAPYGRHNLLRVSVSVSVAVSVES